MDVSFVFATTILLVMLMDPFGNLPVFLALLKGVPRERFYRIVLRESFFALLAMLIALVTGRSFMKLMHISPPVLGIAGGLILLIMGIKMVFAGLHHEEVSHPGEQVLVPLAIPLICGPGLIAMLVTIRGSTPAATLLNCAWATIFAWIIQTVILLSGKQIAAFLGVKLLDALESLMGLLLSCIAVGMLIDGINRIYGLTPPGL